MRNIFVYGTLLEGEPSYRVLAGAPLVRRTRTAPAYTLVSLGAFPALIEGGITRVAGDVYLVDAFTLAAVDRLEGVPRFYQRMMVRLEGVVPAEAYDHPREQAVGGIVIASGDGVDHQTDAGDAFGQAMGEVRNDEPRNTNLRIRCCILEVRDYDRRHGRTSQCESGHPPGADQERGIRA